MIYPHLSTAQQRDLPALIRVPEPIRQQFADSTHQLWHCETVDGPMVLKVCDLTSVKASSFWLGLNQLFGIDFPSYLGKAQRTARYLSRYGALLVPEVIAAQDQRFVLVRFIAGIDHQRERVTDAHVKQLGKHIGQLHQQRFEHWGDLHAPKRPASTWSERLEETLAVLAEQSPVEIPQRLLEEVLSEARAIEATDFVTIMPDLRWDQLRILENSDDLVLIDLDAFVIGPRALELVLITYLLTPSQLRVFKASYCQHNDWPEMGAQQRTYQLLLFLLNVLGETDLARWMAHA